MSAVCPSCRRSFIYTGDDEPPSRGRLYCRAITTWSPDDWARRAGMAGARRACGLDRNEWDDEGLRQGGAT